MPEPDDPAVALRRAIETRDFERVGEATERLRMASIENILTQLETAIQEDRVDDAELLLEELGTRYQTRTDGTAATIASAELVQSTNDTSFDTVQSLTSYLGTATETKLQRAELLTTAGSYLDDAGSVTDPQAVVEAVSATRKKEQTFESETEAAQSIVDGASLPPKITTTGLEFEQGQLAPEETLTATIGVINVGDEPATALTVTVSVPAGLSSVSETKTVDQLAGGTTTTVGFSITANDTGLWTVEVTVEGSDVNQTADSNTIVVTDDATIFSVARFDRDSDGQIGFDDLRYATREYNRDSITFDQLRRVVQAYDDGRQV